eukprot:COSAG05_NODE_37_length_27688_cov_18.080394_20_plen_269_part_00
MPRPPLPTQSRKVLLPPLLLLLLVGGRFLVHPAAAAAGWESSAAAGGAPAVGVDPRTVKRVHLIQANHLDLGFSDLATRVLNRYLVGGPGTADPDHNDAPCFYDSFLGSAAATAAMLRTAGAAPRFQYMADSWVVDLFRECPQAFPSVGLPWDPEGLVCPNASLAATVLDAVKSGDIWMHAFPHNGQAELMDMMMFEAGVNMSIETAEALHSPHRPQVLSQRDVPVSNAPSVYVYPIKIRLLHATGHFTGCRPTPQAQRRGWHIHWRE